jgi:transposase
MSFCPECGQHIVMSAVKRKARTKRACALYAAGDSVQSIAALFGVSGDLVYRWIRHLPKHRPQVKRAKIPPTI